MRSFSMIILSLAIMVGIAWANIITVGNSYPFIGDYTTIQEAVDNSQPYDTIQVLIGIYDESVSISGHSHDYLVIQAKWYGYPSSAVYWYADEPGYLAQVNDVAGVVIQGFTIVNTSCRGITFNSPGETLSIRHNTIYGSPGYGICAILGGGYGDNNGTLEIHNNILREINGFAIEGGYCRIINNTFVECNTAICLLDSNSFIHNNIFQDCGTGIGWWQGTIVNTGNIMYNVFWETDYPVQNIESPGIPFLIADPLSAEPWYYLAVNSPCRDAGNPDPVYNDPDDSQNDIGCYGGPGGWWNGWDGFPQSAVGNENAKLNFNYQISASPNPFNPTTAISYQLPTTSNVKLKVYDLAGRMVSELVNSRQTAGEHTVNFNGSTLASGVYLCQIIAGDYNATQKLVLAK